MLPLFLAAGGIMFPTVVGGGLALARTDWAKWVRVVCLALALVPVAFVSSQIVGNFGWSWQALAGIIGLVALYAVIVAATRSTLTRQPDGWRVPRTARIALMVMAGLVVVIPAVGVSF